MHSLNVRPKLLIVEDDDYWIDHYRVALKHIPIGIQKAKSVKEASALLASNCFSGLIVDLELPGIRESAFGGFEVIEYAERRNPYVEKLVITGQTAQDVLDRVSRSGVRFIAKPVDHRELSISVHAMIAAWEKHFHTLESILDQFTSAVQILQDRGRKKPNVKISDEYDLQDLLHFLCKPLFPDVVVEEYTLKRAGRTKRLDLVVKGLETVVETKMVRTKDHAGRIPDELDIDIRGYCAHPHCRRLFCYVYDPKQYTKDPRSIEKDLSGEQSQDGSTIDVAVMVRPL